MSSTDERNLVRIDFEYSLRGPGGFRTPDTHSKTWFFELPKQRDSDEAWEELLHRIMYDCNVRLKRQEPGDLNWLHAETFKRSPVDVPAMLASDGKSFETSPWFAAMNGIVWEVRPCYMVGDDGRYDVLNAGEFTELILWRQLNAGNIDKEKFIGFFDHMLAINEKPPMGQRIYDGAPTRLANLTEIRAAAYYQKPPGEKPWLSGPVDPHLISA